MDKYFEIGLAFGLGIEAARFLRASLAEVCKELEKLRKKKTVENIRDQKPVQSEMRPNTKVRIKGFCAE